MPPLQACAFFLRMSHRKISRIQPVLIGELRLVSHEMDQQEAGPNDTMAVNAQFWFHEQFWLYKNPPPSSHDAEAAESSAR